MTQQRFLRDAIRSAPASVPGGGDADVQVEIGRVGHSDAVDSEVWMRLEGEQAWVEVTTSSGDEITARVGADVRELALGDGVVLQFLNADPQQAVVVGRVYDGEAPMPGNIAGVSTGADATSETDVVAPAPVFYFMRTREGRLFALETGAGGDVVVHSGAGVHIKASATHIEGRVNLGLAPTTPPTGALVGVPGAPMVEHVPVPVLNPTIPPYAGPGDAVLRAKDDMAANVATSPSFFGYLVAMEAMFAAWGVLLPVLEPARLAFNAATLPFRPLQIVSKPRTASPLVRAGG
jgi:translation initiation factor IF-1